MNLLFIGPQGSGKGTQAKIISEELNLCHISTGDLLRNIEGELKKEVDICLNAGNLVPDELLIKVLEERIKKPDCQNGIILDGSPRNLNQAEKIDKILKIDKVIEISISDEESIKRISGRLLCPKCKASFNELTSPKPKQKEICDFCGTSLTRRSDDTPQAVAKRLQIYHSETEPLLKRYDSIKINGEQTIEKVTEDILENL